MKRYNDNGTPFVLLTLDLDHFKSINDSYGHTAGDLMLKGIADTLQNSVRANDTVARVGGDEFTVLLDSATERNATPIAEQILEDIENYRLNWGGAEHAVSVSIGMAEICKTTSSLESIILASDASCIDAKNCGKNQIKIHDRAA